MSLKVGLAGYGRRGRGHIRAINEIEAAQLTSISDPIELARDAARAELNGISVYSSVGEMVNSGDVDAVIVTAPAHLKQCCCDGRGCTWRASADRKASRTFIGRRD